MLLVGNRRFSIRQSKNEEEYFNEGEVIEIDKII